MNTRAVEVTGPLLALGYEIRIIKPPQMQDALWNVYSEEGQIFSGPYSEFMKFRDKELYLEMKQGA